jgi:hypothetical protein
MASLQRPDGRWRARYRDAADKEHSRHFARKLDAQCWLDEVTTSVVTGQYVDPKAGRVTFETFYAEWAARQVWVATTAGDGPGRQQRALRTAAPGRAPGGSPRPGHRQRPQRRRCVATAAPRRNRHDAADE